MSAYLMKQGMPATAGRKADRFIYAGSVGTVVLLVAGKEYPIGMYLTVFLLTLCGFICVALGTEAYAFAFGVPAVCYGGLSFWEVFIASWAVLMQGKSIQDVEIGHAAKNSKLPDRGCNISWLCLFYLQKENHKENRRGI